MVMCYNGLLPLWCVVTLLGTPFCIPKMWYTYTVSMTVAHIEETPRPGSVVVECLPGMREVGGSIPGRVKQKTLEFEVLLLCLALSTKELETV